MFRIVLLLLSEMKYITLFSFVGIRIFEKCMWMSRWAGHLSSKVIIIILVYHTIKAQSSSQKQRAWGRSSHTCPVRIEHFTSAIELLRLKLVISFAHKFRKTEVRAGYLKYQELIACNADSTRRRQSLNWSNSSAITRRGDILTKKVIKDRRRSPWQWWRER